MCSGSKLEDYRKKYGTFQGAYSPEMIEDLIKKAGENVLNNKETLLGVIKDIIEQKLSTSAWKKLQCFYCLLLLLKLFFWKLKCVEIQYALILVIKISIW